MNTQCREKPRSRKPRDLGHPAKRFEFEKAAKLRGTIRELLANSARNYRKAQRKDPSRRPV